MKVHWPCLVSFAIVVAAFLFQSARVWFLEQRNAAGQAELKKLRRALRSRFRVVRVDAPPSETKPRRMQPNAASGAAKHMEEHDEMKACKIEPPCQPVETPPAAPKLRMMKGNVGRGFQSYHAIAHDYLAECECYPKCEPADGEAKP